MISSDLFAVGDRFTNEYEVGPDNNPIEVDILHVWVDEEDEDQTVYYIIKCRHVAPNQLGRTTGAWLWEEDVDMVSHGHLNKYYDKVKHNV